MQKHVFTVITLGLCVVLIASGCQSGRPTITGELKKWHKVTLTFDGPESSELAEPNPFLHYRLVVIFSNGNKSYTVPGYYAADGNAANTSAHTGNKWRVHFTPDDIGTWNYLVSFRKGDTIALDAASAGQSAGFMDGAAGTIEIGVSDKEGRDFRARGRLQYVDEHYLRFAETGEWFLKCGADAPENLLAYVDIDGDFKNDGQKDQFIKTWQAHVRDWNEGDPVWQGDKGKGLIGALNYLASEQMNVFSFLTMNIEGDDRNVFPYISYDDYKRMDVSKLDQWEIVFEHADKLGLYLHFKTQETENDSLLDDGDLGVERKLYYRELIARFSHHLALNWNLGEENTNSTERQIDFAQYIHDLDPYQHIVVIHTYPNQHEKVYRPLLGEASVLRGASIQTNKTDFSRVHEVVDKWVMASHDAGVPWIIAVDEPGDAQHSLVPDSDDPEHNDARKNGLWGALMAGSAGLEWYFGYKHDDSDLTCQDWRSRDLFWDQCRYAILFFKDNGIPFWEMISGDELISSKDAYCFYKENEQYIVYLKNGGHTRLDLRDAAGSFDVKWYNPRTGEFAGSVSQINGGKRLEVGPPPSDTENDWVVWLVKN